MYSAELPRLFDADSHLIVLGVLSDWQNETEIGIRIRHRLAPRPTAEQETAKTAQSRCTSSRNRFTRGFMALTHPSCRMVYTGTTSVTSISTAAACWMRCTPITRR